MADPTSSITSLAAGDKRTNRSLHVMCVNYEYPPMGGGAGNATHQTALELARRGHVVDVVTSKVSAPSRLQSEKNLTIHRCYSHRRSIHEAGLFGAATFLLSAFGRIRRLTAMSDYDIFHFYFGLPTGLLALYVHWVLKKPYILALRGSDVPGYDTTRWCLRPLHRLLRPLTRLIWTRAAAVTALSENLKTLAQQTTPQLDIAVINNAIDTTLFTQKSHTPYQGPTRLLCVCRLVKRKGLEHLIRAMVELQHRNMVLSIVGTGERSAEIQNLVAQLDLQQIVTLPGYVPRHQLAEHYQNADIFVLPSISESFGQVLLEAMSCGLPIVATKVGGIPETVHDGIGGMLIEPANYEAIVTAVTELHEQPSLRDSMSAYNLKRVAENYSWSTVAAQNEQLYFSALSEIDRDVVVLT